MVRTLYKQCFIFHSRSLQHFVGCSLKNDGKVTVSGMTTNILWIFSDIYALAEELEALL